MKYFSIVMSDEDIENFENGRLREKMSKSAYVRYLIAEHERTLPPVYKYKEIIALLSSIDNSVRQILLNEKFEISDRMALYEKFEKVRLEISKKLKFFLNKSDLIAGLASAFYGTENSDVHIDATNYIANTKSIDASAMGLDLEDLRKTRAVISEYIASFTGSNDMAKAQVISHLNIARKCVDHVISQKLEKEPIERHK